MIDITESQVSLNHLPPNLLIFTNKEKTGSKKKYEMNEQAKSALT